MAELFDIYGVPFQQYVHKLSKATSRPISSVSFSSTCGDQSVDMQYWLDDEDQKSLQTSRSADGEKGESDPKQASSGGTAETDPRFKHDSKPKSDSVKEPPSSKSNHHETGSEAWFKKDIVTEVSKSTAGSRSSKRIDYWKTCSLDNKAALIGKLLVKWKRGDVSVDDDKALAAAQS
jgi:hypothetical protein